MFKGDRNFAVGLFISIAIAAFIGFVIWLTGRSGAEEMTRYSLMFQRDVSGLAVGGPVKYMGMNIGSVVQMSLERQRGIRVRVDIEVLESTPVDSGTYAGLALQGITGVAVVNLASEPGDHEPLTTPEGREYPEIPVRVMGFSAVLSSAPQIMSKLDHLLTQAGEMLGEENRGSVAGTLDNLESVTAALAGNSEQIAAIPGNLSETLVEIRATVEQLQGVIGGLEPALAATMDNIHLSSENLVSLTARVDAMLHENEEELSRFMEDGLAEAPVLMNEMRRAMRDLEKLVSELRDDPSQLIYRSNVTTVEIEP